MQCRREASFRFVQRQLAAVRTRHSIGQHQAHARQALIGLRAQSLLQGLALRGIDARAVIGDLQALRRGAVPAFCPFPTPTLP
mgnify:CR=1 FL=1